MSVAARGAEVVGRLAWPVLRPLGAAVARPPSTAAYRGLPTFSAQQGAAFVLRALAHRPHAVALGIRTPLRVLDGLAPGVLASAVARLAPRHGSGDDVRRA